MHELSTRRKHQHVELLTDLPECLEAPLWIHVPDVFDEQRRGPVELDGGIERQPARSDVACVLLGIVAEAHGFIVYTKMQALRWTLVKRSPLPIHRMMYEIDAPHISLVILFDPIQTTPDHLSE